MAGTLKVTCWNIKFLHRVISPDGPAKDRAREALVRRQIAEMNPDVLCIVEASPDVRLMRSWAASLHEPYDVPVIPRTDEILNAALAADPTANPREVLCKVYGYPNSDVTGAQWIWFFVKKSLGFPAELLDPKVWRSFAASQYADAADQGSQDGKWGLFFYAQNQAGRWGHVRQPQVLVLDVNGVRMEFVGAHLRSKLNNWRGPIWTDAARTTFDKNFLDEAYNDRIKLATEAENIRKYVDARYAQESDPAIFVMGDLNDGPGREVFERKFLFFDLIGNVQGSIFEADRFLNHALFDFGAEASGENLRWSYKLEGQDKVDPTRDPKILLDHILFTQRLVDKAKFPRVKAKAGFVEHAVHERVNAARPRRSEPSSDHRPVSVVVTLSE